MAKGVICHQLSSTSGTVSCTSSGEEMPILCDPRTLQSVQHHCSLSLTSRR